ncbi:MAG: TetR/AcrR family transcriptional regulator [Mycobacterium sp.]|nr:TetR/AcrR family transcriptional regulator [Mycobacterium sp.]
MTEGSARRTGATRDRLIAAAARQFARRPYSMVSLDDILAEAQLTKGAMYFHFPSKQALAMAIIDDVSEMNGAAINELLARQMSALETLIDLVYLLAVQNTQDEVARAGVRLLETFDDSTAQADARWRSWVEFVGTLIERAVAEGDIVERHKPEDIATMLVALWTGIQRISDLDQPERYFDNLRIAWTQALGCVTNPDRAEYFDQFIQRRHALAMKMVSVGAPPELSTAAAGTEP